MIQARANSVVTIKKYQTSQTIGKPNKSFEAKILTSLRNGREEYVTRYMFEQISKQVEEKEILIHEVIQGMYKLTLHRR